MRVIRLSYGIRGFVRLARYGLKWLSMLTNKAKFKAKVLSFWTRHGLEATLDAFPVKRSTLFLWKQKIKQGNGNLESLNELSKAPRLKRRRLWSPAVIAEIRRLRLVYPNLGKEMDSIERREFGLKRYIITFVDIYSRFTFAWGYTGHGSDTARDFLNNLF